MAISDKITSIQDHLKDDWDSVESLIGDTELDKNIENISSALDDLYNDLPKVTGSGTSITLDDTRKGRLESTLSGNTSQTQYTGKNLLPPTIATETKDGITLTNNGDGSYTLTGTYSTSTTFEMALPATLNGTYSFSGNNPTAGKNIQFRISASSGSSLSTYLNNVNKTVENKTIENGTKQSIRIVGSFTSGFTFKPQLESGSTATSYEPYVGGVATPNPTNPADVNVVSGDNEIVVSDKMNLFNKGNALRGYEITNGSTGAIGVNADWFVSDYIEVTPNTEYTFIGKTSGSVNVYFDTNKTAVTQQSVVNGTFTLPSSSRIKYMRFNAKLTDIDNVVLIKGTGTYQGNTYNIDLPVENLFNGIYYYTYTGGSSPYPYASAASTRSGVIKVEPNTTYTISKEVSNRFRISEYTEQPVVGSSNAINYIYPQNEDSITSYTLTTQSNTQYLVVQVTNSSQENIKMQVEKGSKANSYTPYGTTPIEMCKIGNYQDYFYKDSDKWYLHKEIGKKVLNGTETWILQSTKTSGYNRFRVEIGDNLVNTSSSNVLPMYCNKLSVISPDGTFLRTQGIASDSNANHYFNVYIEDVSTYTLANFKTWLSSNNLEVWYPLATPTTTGITDTTLINQLEELYIAKSKENQTNISQVNNDLPFIINATALLDANTYIMQLEAELEASS